jgi:peptidyl-prolyl cis-trans isomerase D
MLNAIRKGASSVFVMVLMGLLIASFAIWGIGDVFRQTSTSKLATVGSETISTQGFVTEFQREMQMFKRKLGPTFTPAQAVSLGLGDRVIQNMVAREAFRQAAARIGLRIPDARVAFEIKKNDVFKNSLGQFDRQTYEGLLHTANMTSRQFEENTREDLARQDLLQTLATSVSAPDAMVALLYTYRKETRMAQVLTVPASTITNVGEPSDDALRAYHKASARLFMAPEYRKLTFLLLTPEDRMADMTVTDDELKEQYQKRIEEFNRPEQRDAEQIVLSSEADAKKWHDLIKGGMNFLKAAKDSVGSSDADAKLGLISQHTAAEQINPAAAAILFKLKPGEVSEPVRSQFGWHLFRVLSVKPGEEMPLPEVKDKLTATLKREKAVDAIIKIADKIDEKLAAGTAIEDIASSLGLKAGQIAAVDRQGNGRDGKPAAGMPKVSGFMDAAFATDAGSAPILRDTGEGGYYAVSVGEVIPPVLKPLDQVRDAVANAWKAEKREEAAKAKATEIAAKINGPKMAGGVELASFTKEVNGQFHDDVPVAREDVADANGKKPEAQKIIFGLVPGKAGIAKSGNGDGYLVIELKSIVAGDPAKDSEGFKAMKQQVSSELANDLLSQYESALNRRYGVDINKSMLKKVTSQIAGENAP